MGDCNKATQIFIIYWPSVKVLAVVAALVAFTAYCFIVRFPRFRGLTVFVRIVGAFLVIGWALSGIVMLVGRGLNGRTNPPRTFASPDSQYMAYQYYDPGFLGRDSSGVAIGNNCMNPEWAYQYEGPSEWSDTEVRWVDKNQLLIRYFADNEGRFQECKTKIAGVTVQCVPMARGRVEPAR